MILRPDSYLWIVGGGEPSGGVGGLPLGAGAPSTGVEAAAGGDSDGTAGSGFGRSATVAAGALDSAGAAGAAGSGLAGVESPDVAEALAGAAGEADGLGWGDEPIAANICSVRGDSFGTLTNVSISAFNSSGVGLFSGCPTYLSNFASS